MFSIFEKVYNYIFKPKIAHKLVYLIVTLLLITTILLSFLYYQSSKNALIQRTIDQLESVKILKYGWLQDFFSNETKILNTVITVYENYESNIKINTIENELFLDKILTINQIAYIDSNGCVHQKVNSKLNSSPLSFKIKSEIKNLKLKNWIIISNDNNFNLWLVYKLNDYLSLAKELKVENLNKILTQRSGLGKTGESYLVDENKIFRTDSRFLDSENYKITVNTIAVSKALNGVSGSEIINDYRNVEVLSSYKPFVFLNLNWVIISEIDYAEAMISIYKLRDKLIIFTSIIIVFAILFTFWISKYFTKPIKDLNYLIKEMSIGKLPKLSASENSSDEIDEMKDAVKFLADKLKKTAVFAENIGKGDFDQPYQILSKDDILGRALVDMRFQLISLNEKIINQNKIKTLALLEGQEKERQRISRDLHDSVGQMLTAIRFRLQNIENSAAYKAEIKNLIDETIQELKRVVVNLMPSVIWDFGLEAAIKILIQNAKSLDIDFSYHKAEDTKLLPLDMRLTIYRIIQESINNILKYAHTNKVELKIEKTKYNIYLKIQDFGKGFLIDEIYKNEHNKHGIKNIKERVYLLNGKCEITSIINTGTTIEIWIPIINKDE